MGYTPTEWIALIFIIFSLVKILIVIINKDFWINKISKRALKNPHPYAFLFLILSFVSLYYLLKELSIVQIIAASTFMILLVGFGMLQYTKELETVITKIQKSNHIIKRAWIYIVIWLIILLWGLKEIIL